MVVSGPVGERSGYTFCLSVLSEYNDSIPVFLKMSLFGFPRYPLLAGHIHLALPAAVAHLLTWAADCPGIFLYIGGAERVILASQTALCPVDGLGRTVALAFPAHDAVVCESLVGAFCNGKSAGGNDAAKAAGYALPGDEAL